MILASFVNAIPSYSLVNKVLTPLGAVVRAIQVRGAGGHLHSDPGPMLRSPVGRVAVGGRRAVVRRCRLRGPGVIAHDMARQGISKTVNAVLLAGGIVGRADRGRTRGSIFPVSTISPRSGGFVHRRRGMDPDRRRCARPPQRGASRATGTCAAAASWAPPSSPSWSAIPGRSASPLCISAATYLLVKHAADELDDPVRPAQVLVDAARLGVAVVEPAVAGQPHLRSRHPEPHGHRARWR